MMVTASHTVLADLCFVGTSQDTESSRNRSRSASPQNLRNLQAINAKLRRSLDASRQANEAHEASFAAASIAASAAGSTGSAGVGGGHERSTNSRSNSRLNKLTAEHTYI